MARRALVWSAVVGLMLPGVARGGATTLREPAFGLPHINADTDLELARENGKQIARDRLGQLILLARVGRGTLYQVFGLLDPTILNDDIEARQTAYTSSELNSMYAKLPQRERDIIMEYCRGVNDTIDAVYHNDLPEPIEVSVLRNSFGLSNDLFGNATNISDQVDPNYLAPGGADPQHPNGGFQFTPELAMAIGVLEIRNFGINGFEEASLLTQLQTFESVHGATAGEQMWDDLNFLNDPLAPVSVPDSTTPGFGGPLAKAKKTTMLAAAKKFPRRDYAAAAQRRKERQEHREMLAKKLGAWPMMGSYAWMIGGGKSSTGFPWIGGFPQTGIQTPSIMHFAENRSAEGTDHRIDAVGMEFAGAPFILIGHTNSVGYTTTTAQLRMVDTFFEQVIDEDVDNVRYDDEGTPAPLSKRTEIFHGIGEPQRIFWRSHARGGNGGSRSIIDFRGDAEGAVTGAAATTLSATGPFGPAYNGGSVLIIDGPGAGQIRQIASATATTLTLGVAWTTLPTAASTYVAVQSGNDLIAVAADSSVWMEESTAVLGFAQYQRAETIMDIRAGLRLIPSTHNFVAADNKPFNGTGTASGTGGNIGYWSSGYERIRQGGLDPRLPMDGTGPNPLVKYSGTVQSATSTAITATASVFGVANLSPPATNARYLSPTGNITEYIVAITSGTGYKQTRRIASNTAGGLTVESPWGVIPGAGDTFEVYQILGMPEAVNPSEQYTSNWNNKAATTDQGDNFGRQFRNIFIHQKLAAENAWTRDLERTLNKDLAGLDGRGDYGRYLIPRLQQAVTAVGNGGNPNVDTVLAALVANNGPPFLGRNFVDPVTSTTNAGELAFLNNLVNQLARDIYLDEYTGVTSVPTGFRALNIVQHAIDSAAGDVTGSYAQQYSGDYFNGAGWQTRVRDTLSALSGSIPAPSARGVSNYNHPLRDAFLALSLPADAAKLAFEPTPFGNRGTYEQIIDVGPTVKGEFIFPLGQSGLIQGGLGGVTAVDPNVTTLQPIWRDWRFVPMLRVSADLAANANGDSDADGVLDGYERWYFGNLNKKGTDDGDHDKAKLADEYMHGTAPTVADTDGDGIPDGRDTNGQDRLRSGFLKLKPKIKFGANPNTDILTFVGKLGAGGTEFDPATRAITLTLSDDNLIYTVTIPAGTLIANPTGKRFLYSDPSGTLGGVKKAIFAKGKPGGLATLKILTIPMNLSNADPVVHEVTTSLTFGAMKIEDTRLFDLFGSTLKPLL